MKARIWKHRTWDMWFASVPDESGSGSLVTPVPTWEEALAVVLGKLDKCRPARS